MIYGGSGIYYDQVILNIIGNARFTPPKVIGIQIDSVAGSPLSWPDPFNGGAVSYPPPTVSIIDPALVTPWNWNTRSATAGNWRATSAWMSASSITAATTTSASPTRMRQCPAPPMRPAASRSAAGPIPTFGTKNFYNNYGDIRYKGLLVDLKKRFSHGYQGGIAYTLSKTENNSFNFVSGLQVPTQPDLSFGPDTEDRRHRIAAHSEINIPFGIQLGLIVEYRSEAPLDIIATGRDFNGDGLTGDWVNESMCIARTGVAACPGFNYSRNSVRELTTEEANALRAYLLGQTARDRQLRQQPEVLQRRRDAAEAVPVRPARRAPDHGGVQRVQHRPADGPDSEHPVGALRHLHRGFVAARGAVHGAVPISDRSAPA